MNANQVIITTPQELHSLIKDAVNVAVQQISFPQKVEPPPKEFVDIHEAAEYLNLALPTVYSLVSKRKIASIKRGKKLLFKPSALREYLENGTRETINNTMVVNKNNLKQKNK